MKLHKYNTLCCWKIQDVGSFGVPCLEYTTDCGQSYDSENEIGKFCLNCGKKLIHTSFREKIITIHYDFTDKTEISYKEGLECNKSFTTNCLEFFSEHTQASDIIVLSKEYGYISRRELLLNSEIYISKEIRPEHNLTKMLLANSFEWQKIK